jgi:signal recognition particle subunit SRP68
MLHRGAVYKPRPLELKHITEARYLELPLFQAERAWSYAMQLKDDLNEDKPRLRFHLLKRLDKAIKHAQELERLCATCADTRTQLEAEGYSAWLSGTLRLEREQHQEAMVKFSLAKNVFEQLANVSTGEVRGICLERAESIKDNLRYCE